MIYTLEQIDQLTKESVRRENALIAEYRRSLPILQVTTSARKPYAMR